MYLINNFLNEQQVNSEKFVSNYMKYYNFLFIKEDFINESSFHLLCKYDYYILVKILMTNKNIDVNKIYKFECSISENDAYIEMAKRWGYETNHNDNIDEEKVPLYIAIENNNIEIAKLLLNNDNIDVNICNKSSCCLKLFDSDRFFYIVKEEDTLLHLAITKENIEIVKLLLNNNNIDVNQIYKFDEFGRDASDNEIVLNEETPLHLAIKLGNVEIVKLLLLNETIDVNMKYKTNHVLSNEVYGDQCREIIPLSLAFVMIYYPTSNIQFTPLSYTNDMIIDKTNYIEIIKLLLMNNNTDTKKCDTIKKIKDWAASIRRLWKYNENNYIKYFKDNEKKGLYELFRSNNLLKMAKSLQNQEIIKLLSQENTEK